jgi:hypothetical protein
VNFAYDVLLGDDFRKLKNSAGILHRSLLERKAGGVGKQHANGFLGAMYTEGRGEKWTPD